MGAAVAVCFNIDNEGKEDGRKNRARVYALERENQNMLFCVQ